MSLKYEPSSEQVMSGCLVVIRSHATGAFLGTGRGGECEGLPADASCPAWHPSPAAWRLTASPRPTSTAVNPEPLTLNPKP